MAKIYTESELVFEEKPKNGNFQELTNQVFGRLTVLGYAGRKPSSHWFCKCECGTITKVRAGSLKSGVTASCGCFGLERIKETNTKHGHKTNGHESRTYATWKSMLYRCQNPNHQSFKNYGDREIKVCERWLKFENFLADMGERPKKLTLDRIENDKGYYKENCRWATPKQQSNNTRKNRMLTYNGRTQNVTQWSEELGLKGDTISHRLYRGWSVEQALTIQV